LDTHVVHGCKESQEFQNSFFSQPQAGWRRSLEVVAIKLCTAIALSNSSFYHFIILPNSPFHNFTISPFLQLIISLFHNFLQSFYLFTILPNFPNFVSRQAAWNARFSFKRSTYAVSEDLPLSVRIQRALKQGSSFEQFILQIT